MEHADRPTALPTTAIDHIGIAVADLDAAIEFYTAVLGGHLTHRERNEEQGVEEAMIAFGPPGSTAVQLLAPTSPDSPVGRFLARRGPGLQQLALRVADVGSSMTAARAAGLRLLDDQPRHGTLDSAVAFIHPTSAGGVLVELVEPAPGH